MNHAELLAEALAAYGMERARAELLQDDREVVFRVWRGGADFALRIYLGGRSDRRVIWSQCQWLRAIGRETKLVVPEPVENRDGEDVTRVKGGWCTLTRWVEGRRRFWRNGPGAVVMRDVGKVMARLHEHGRNFVAPRGFRCARWDWEGLFGERSSWRPQRRVVVDAGTRRLFARVMRKGRRVMEELGTGREVFGLIHGDLMQANYIVHRGEVRAIDFGDFGRGYFLYDMAVTLLMLRPFDSGGKQGRAFVEGYREVRGLGAEHEALLDDFVAVRAVVLARWALGAAEAREGDLRWVRQTLPWLGRMV